MSTSFTPGKDLILQSKVPQVPTLFTTFATGHFVKPGNFTQPVKQAVPAPVKSESFAGGYCEFFAAAPLDLDYDEPNAVTEAELDVVQAGTGVHQMEIPLVDGLATNERELPASEVSGEVSGCPSAQRAAA